VPFARCYYHIIWATYRRQPLISEAIEPYLNGIVRNKATESRIDVFALNSVADHIHLAVRVPPSVLLSEWIGKVKGATSFAINQRWQGLDTRFQWQESYGVLTFGERYLGKVVEYVVRQKEHHAHNTLLPALERDGE
jgi:putative transposase